MTTMSDITFYQISQEGCEIYTGLNTTSLEDACAELMGYVAAGMAKEDFRKLLAMSIPEKVAHFESLGFSFESQDTPYPE